MKSSEIKKIGKKAILGNRKEAIFIDLFPVILCLMMTAIIYGIIVLSQKLSSSAVGSTNEIIIFAVTAVILGLLSLLTLGAYSSTSVGKKAWYNGLISSKENYTRRFFFWFKPKASRRALCLKLLLNVLKLSEAVFFSLPGIMIFITIFYLAQTGGIELYLFYSLFAGALLLTLCGLSFAFVAAQRYFLAEYIFSSKPKITAALAIKQSKNLLDGHIMEIVRFKLSFFPWFLVCLLIFPTIYFVPYYKASCSLVAKRIVL